MLFESLLSKYLEALPMHDNRQTSIEAIRDAITSHGHAMFWKAQKGISGVWECRSRGKYLGQPATAFCLRLTDDGWYVGTYSYRSFVLPKHIDAIAASAMSTPASAARRMLAEVTPLVSCVWK